MDPDYTDVPAASLHALCTTCHGTGVVLRPIKPSPVVDVPFPYETQADPCPDCEQHEGAPSEGHVNVGTGPGAKLRRVDRVKLPGDDWPRLRPR